MALSNTLMKFTPTLLIIFFPRPCNPIKERNEVNLMGITFSEPSLTLPTALITNTGEEAALVMLKDSVLDNIPFNYEKVSIMIIHSSYVSGAHM